MSEYTIGKIELGNTREGVALKTLSEAVMERRMWLEESIRKDEEIERLKKEIERLKHGRKKQR